MSEFTICSDDIIQILTIAEETGVSELKLEVGDTKLIVKQGGLGTEINGSGICRGNGEELNFNEERIGSELRVEDEEKITTKKLEDEIVLEEENLVPVKAPMLGTFYRAPRPGAPPYVNVGDIVNENDTIGLIEVMKLMNAVKAGIKGRISKILVENGKMVEYGQVILLVDPESGNA